MKGTNEEVVEVYIGPALKKTRCFSFIKWKIIWLLRSLGGSSNSFFFIILNYRDLMMMTMVTIKGETVKGKKKSQGIEELDKLFAHLPGFLVLFVNGQRE